MSQAKITPLSGFPEFLPADRIVEQHLLDVIQRTFELHGFVSVETRAVEPVERLVGKGGDADKEIYAVSRLAGRGDGAGSAATADAGSELGLHFDLTVPLARYVLENAGKLQFPLRRYQIQRSWRGERPQEGRYREFTQADIDIIDVDTLAPHFEAELPLILAGIFEQLPVGDFVVKVNNRLICEGFYRGIGIEDVATTLRIVDKLDKIGAAGVEAMLVESGLNAAQARQCLALAAIRSTDLGFVDAVRALGVTHPDLDEGLMALAAVIREGMAHAPGRVEADLRIARGLDYYTGTVYETFLLGHPEFGAVCSGGRYDELASDGVRAYPGVGVSIGVTRLMGLIVSRGLATASRSTPAAVLVAVNDEASRPRSNAVAAALRARGVACEVAPAAAKFGKQIRYADRRGIPFVWFPARDAEAVDQVKDIRTGEQQPADERTWSPPAEDLYPTVIAAHRDGDST
ncbi:MAG: histidine--tRNA ligase [Dermatophilaceae bacterium]